MKAEGLNIDWMLGLVSIEFLLREEKSVYLEGFWHYFLYENSTKYIKLWGPKLLRCLKNSFQGWSKLPAFLGSRQTLRGMAAEPGMGNALECLGNKSYSTP